MAGDGTRSRLLTAQPGPPAEEARLDLAHADEGEGHASSVGRLDDAHSLSDEKVLKLAEWVYLNVEEVWSGFNLLAEAVARGFEATARTDEDQGTVDAWNRRVGIEDKARMWVKNALVYGRCVMEAGTDFLKVRNPRTMTLDQDDDGNLVEVTQDLDDGSRDIPVDRVQVFTLHSLFSDDLEGISAVRPVLQTLDDQVGLRRVNRALQERYRAPIRLIELPQDATEEDRQTLQSQLEETPPDMDLVLPSGASITVLGHGDDGLEVDDLIKHHLVDRVFLGLGIPKVALGIPDDANRATSETQRRLLLQQKVKPYQRQVREFAEGLYHEVLDVDVTVGFGAVDVASMPRPTPAKPELVGGCGRGVRPMVTRHPPASPPPGGNPYGVVDVKGRSMPDDDGPPDPPEDPADVPAAPGRPLFKGGRDDRDAASEGDD